MAAEKKIGLALSGGGIRAMAFHCGVLRWLAENGQLEDVSHISSVSGGSLFAGLIFTINELKWPSSTEYLETVEPKISMLLTETNLQAIAIARLLLPTNWRFLLSRANVLSQTIETVWRASAKVNELPSSPVWTVNGTTAETGKRFRFKKNECGDYEVGYADAGNFSLANIMAVSAAFPVGIGPFAVKTADLTWRKRERWDDPPESRKIIKPSFDTLHIYP